MRRLFLASVLLLSASLPLFSQTAKNADVIRNILDLPAPAPPGDNLEDAKKRERTADFLSYKNIPPDDAPIEDLTDYWASQTGDRNRFNFRPEASDRTIERLLEYCEENPDELPKFLSTFPAKPEIAERIKHIYDKYAQEKESEAYEFTPIRDWLTSNSTYYVSELIRGAQKIKDTNEYISNEAEYTLRALARVDWDSASPIVSRLASDPSQPYSQLLAKWVLYQHAVDEKNTGDIEKYRAELQEIVENKNEHWRKRDLAMDALVAGGDWEGRDEWYVSLLDDDSLLQIQDNNHTGLTTLISASPPDKWVEKMIELTKSDKLAVRSAAVRNLMSAFSDQKEIAEALLPWLTNPNWAKKSNYNERQRFIYSLSEIDLPESVPGLIAVLTNEEELQTAAAKTLVKYKDARAIPALRAALSNSKELVSRFVFIEALIACGGFSDDEQMEALEAFAVFTSTPEGKEKIQNQYGYESDGETASKPLPLQINVGNSVANQIEPSEGLVLRAIERLKVLRRTKPQAAQTLAEIMQKWQGRAIYAEMIRQLKTGEANTDLIIAMLTKRKDIREKMPLEVSALQSMNGAARGFGACLAEENVNYLSILGQTDKEAQLALFSCARMLRAKLPLNEVGGFLKSPDKLMVTAAERYLESEDSAAARTMVLANRPNEASILGARQTFFTDKEIPYNPQLLSALFESVTGTAFWEDNSAFFKKNELKLQKEIKEDVDLLAVFGILPNAAAGQQIIRLYKNRVTYTFYEDAARFRERNLTAKEYEEFYRFVIEKNIDGLSSIGSACEECVSHEFVMFGKAGGRRVFIESIYEAPKEIEKLFEFFESFKNSELKLNYLLAKKIKGLEILLAEDKFPVYSVWKKDGDLRFLVEDKARGTEIEKSIVEQFRLENGADEAAEDTPQRYEMMTKRRKEMEFAHYSWRRFENGKPGAVVSQPAETPFLRDETQAAEASEIEAAPRAWQVRTAAGEIRTGSYYEGGLYRAAPGQTAVKFKEGRYANPIVTPDGKWAVVSKGSENWSDPTNIVRINLQTNKEFPLPVQPADALYPLAFLTSHHKILIYRAKGISARYRYEIPSQDDDEDTGENVPIYRPNSGQKPNPSPNTPEYYLLDANTGAAQAVKGEFRPLHELTYRPLQPTNNANEFWAAIYNKKTKATEIGRYNEKTFTFQPLKQVPDLALSSMDIWVDEKEAKVYFVYQGHLLALPLAN